MPERTVGYGRLLAWQQADELAVLIYVATRCFPREELYGLTSQLRRAAISVPLNLAEGCGRQGRREFRHFVNIALGSLAEVEYLLSLTYRLGLLDAGTHERLTEKRERTGALLWRLRESLANSPNA
jgi:four helix bundle protein